MEAKYKIGDKVKVVNWGALYWANVDQLETGFPVIRRSATVIWYDMLPEIVGKIGTIKEVSMTLVQPKYSLDGIPGKVAWYDEAQLEKTEDGTN
jgi:hypothetical protein